MPCWLAGRQGHEDAEPDCRLVGDIAMMDMSAMLRDHGHHDAPLMAG
jgi:hypothetical protein